MQGRGLLLTADDLEIGQQLAVHHCNHWSPLLGESLKITAINLPFVVAKLLAHPESSPVTLDTRDCRLMPVTDAFVAAQQGREPPAPLPLSG